MLTKISNEGLYMYTYIKASVSLTASTPGAPEIIFPILGIFLHTIFTQMHESQAISQKHQETSMIEKQNWIDDENRECEL